MGLWIARGSDAEAPGWGLGPRDVQRLGERKGLQQRGLRLMGLAPTSEGHTWGGGGWRGRAGWGGPEQRGPGEGAGPHRVSTCLTSWISGATSSVSSTVANSWESFKLFTRRTWSLGRVCVHKRALMCACMCARVHVCVHAQAHLRGRSGRATPSPPGPAMLGSTGASQESGAAKLQEAWARPAWELGGVVGLPRTCEPWPGCLVSGLD